MCNSKIIERLREDWKKSEYGSWELLVEFLGIVFAFCIFFGTNYFENKREVKTRTCEIIYDLVTDVNKQAIIVTETINSDLNIPQTCWNPTGTAELPTSNEELQKRFIKWRHEFNSLIANVNALRVTTDLPIQSWDTLHANIQDFVFSENCSQNWHGIFGGKSVGNLDIFVSEVIGVLDSKCLL